MAFGSDEDENAGRLEDTKVYHLQPRIDIFGCLLSFLLYAGCAVGLVVASFTDPASDAYMLLVPAVGFLIFSLHVLREGMPLNASVEISDMGITARAWFQAQRFVPWSGITGVAWVEKRIVGRHGIQWLYSLFLDVPEVTYGRHRIKLGSSIHAIIPRELRDEIIKHSALEEVEQRLGWWTKRQVWRREQLS